MFYCAGLLFYGAVKITVPVFYALKDTRTPVKIAIACMGLNIILNFVFTLFFIRTGIARPLAGLALATSVASMANFIMLRITLRRRVGRVVVSSTPAWLAMIPAAAASLAVLRLMDGWVLSSAATSTLQGLVAILLTFTASMGAFMLLFALTGGAGARSVFRLAFSRGNIRKP
jgi:putative peptidoglycan lipid II flippase